MRAWSYARTPSERALAVQRTYVYGGILSATHLVLWWCGHACGFVVARRFFRALACTRRCVELCSHDSAIPWCMARSASWPSINLAGLICNWISMAPSNVAIVIRSRYLAAPKRGA